MYIKCRVEERKRESKRSNCLKQKCRTICSFAVVAEMEETIEIKLLNAHFMFDKFLENSWINCFGIKGSFVRKGYVLYYLCLAVEAREQLSIKKHAGAARIKAAECSYL